MVGQVADLESALAEARIAAATAAADGDAAKSAGTLEAGLLREQLQREFARVADLERAARGGAAAVVGAIRQSLLSGFGVVGRRVRSEALGG